VSGAGSTLSAQSLTIGAAGNGYLTVSSGESVSWDRLYLAIQSGSQGAATISGATLNLDKIDFSGNGSANLKMGWDGNNWGTANSPVIATASMPLVLGGLTGSSGTISVSGAGSSLSAQSLTIGAIGSGYLSVSNGGEVTANTVLTIGASGYGSLIVSSGGIVTAWSGVTHLLQEVTRLAISP
jgi:T5SS/PEP-CTERM-associated repeat protein